MLTHGARPCRMKFCEGRAAHKSRVGASPRRAAPRSPDRVRDLLLAEEVAARGLRHEARVLKLEVGALDFAAVYGEFSGERGGRGEGVAGGELFVADARFDLPADLQIDGAFGAVFKFYVH